MTEEALKAIEARMETALELAPLPWELQHCSGDDIYFVDYGASPDKRRRFDVADRDERAFWEFIACAPTDLTALIAEVRTLRAMLTSMRRNTLDDGLL